MSHHHFRIHSSQMRKPVESQRKVAVVLETGKEKKLHLPPPPCPTPRSTPHGIHVPLPPCLFHGADQRQRNFSKMGYRKKDDPFLAAYIECTKREQTKSSTGGGFGDGFGFSCRSRVMCGVREDVMVRLPVPDRFSSSHQLRGRYGGKERFHERHRLLVHDCSY